MEHAVIDLGTEVNSKILQFVRSFGLQFSAIDFVITPDDQLIFLEDNPNGQWGWLEHRTGVAISHAIAELLTGF
jgi:glutathione synthase/RimK-type ligase-like ATP-grasp enzyme